MAKFDYMIFEGGADGLEFVVHAAKYSKRQAIDLFCQECWNHYSKPISPVYGDVQTRWVKFFINPPETVGVNEFEGSIYTFCNEGMRGSFPVWVINIRDVNNRE